jgi:hypothetical protein
MNHRTKHVVKSIVNASVEVDSIVVYGYTETDHAVVVAYKTDHQQGMVGRRNLLDGAFEWRHVKSVVLKLEPCQQVVSFDGCWVAVCWGQDDVTVDIFCTVSGTCVATIRLTGCFSFPNLDLSLMIAVPLCSAGLRLHQE